MCISATFTLRVSVEGNTSQVLKLIFKVNVPSGNSKDAVVKESQCWISKEKNAFVVVFSFSFMECQD